MIIKANGVIYDGSPQEIAGELRKLLLNPSMAPDTKSYIKHIQNTYRVISGEEMLLEGDTRQRIRDMFLYMESIGALEVVEDE